MSVINGNLENFDNLTSKGLVLVDFYANWCGPCKMLSPVLEELDSTDINIVKINVDDNEELARKYGIMSIPTLLLFKDGNHVDTKNGFMPLPVLREWLDNYK